MATNQENAQENSQDRDAPDTNPPADDTSAREVARGLTIMRGIIRDRDRGVVYNLAWNADNQVIGPNAAKLTSYLGTLVRMHIPISVPKWNMRCEVLQDKKDMIWAELKVSYMVVVIILTIMCLNYLY